MPLERGVPGFGEPHPHAPPVTGLVRTDDQASKGTAVGRPRLVKGQDVKPGGVVIDTGHHAGDVGDGDVDSAVERASLITPVPGGVSPLTIA
ncbi:hypothetical protein GCM10010251_54980 [Streptomyces aurantiogriseus]|uniref:methenyltetrahydrofolate cyclohydrolase n=1 Tax=Streptomyces aurantiogriseus TaxID=66870 RepID=A0A918FE25_9ACTN|nr:hypothetical protein GCM10010251_54980 [Streptomyces aurantiogriseus]